MSAHECRPQRRLSANWLRSAMLHDRAGQRSPADFDVQLSLGDRDRKMRPALDQARNFINKVGIECVDRNVGKSMNSPRGKLCEKLANVTMSINSGSPRQFVASVQSLRIRHADFDPGGD